jgi:hypothetical protein
MLLPLLALPCCRHRRRSRRRLPRRLRCSALAAALQLSGFVIELQTTYGTSVRYRRLKGPGPRFDRAAVPSSSPASLQLDGSGGSDVSSRTKRSVTPASRLPDRAPAARGIAMLARPLDAAGAAVEVASSTASAPAALPSRRRRRSSCPEWRRRHSLPFALCLLRRPHLSNRPTDRPSVRRVLRDRLNDRLPVRPAAVAETCRSNSCRYRAVVVVADEVVSLPLTQSVSRLFHSCLFVTLLPNPSGPQTRRR